MPREDGKRSIRLSNALGLIWQGNTLDGKVLTGLPYLPGALYPRKVRLEPPSQRGLPFRLILRTESAIQRVRLLVNRVALDHRIDVQNQTILK